MIDVEGDFEGEVKLESIKFSKILTKIVQYNNDTSGKITVPHEYVNTKVVVLFPKIKSRSRKK